jgi:hypothetical protein
VAPGTGNGGVVDPLLGGSKWASLDAASTKTVITYSFADPQTSTFAYADFAASLSAFSDGDRALTRNLLAKIAAVCNVEFVEVADNASQCGVIRYGYSDQPNTMSYAGYAFYPSSSAIGGDVWIGKAQASSAWDFYRGNLVLHETLHAMGLKHPFQGDAQLSFEQNIIPNTVMSYSPVAGAQGATSMSKYPVEPMAFDVAALQALYGVSSANAGDTVYNLAGSDFQGTLRALWDAGGKDTLDASGLARSVTLDLNAGSHSDIGTTVTGYWNNNTQSSVYHATVALAEGVEIENAIGGALADTLIGNGLANRLEGRGGDDLIDGGDGIDVAAFTGIAAGYAVSHDGLGLVVRDAGGGDGTDTLRGVERLQFADHSLAFDIDGGAGLVARVLGAVFGAQSVHNADYVGIGLGLVDGGMSPHDLVAMALQVRLGANASNTDVVDLLFSNVTGHAPNAAERAGYVDMLQSGHTTQALLGLEAADHALNLAQVDLVGLAQSGLAYA